MNKLIRTVLIAVFTTLAAATQAVAAYPEKPIQLIVPYGAGGSTDVLARAIALDTPLVELTGGEPLLQPAAIPLLRELCDAGRTVLLETSGEADVSRVDPRVHKIMDLKAPGSREHHRNRWSNLAHLGPGDEIKFVLADRADYEWMRATIHHRGLDRLGPGLLASTVWGALDPKDLVAWVIEDRLGVRVQVQLHKIIWGSKAQGV